MRRSPCKQCPFRKASAPGYLGSASYEPKSFLATIEHQPIPCHMEVDWEREDPEDKNYSNPCNGSLRFLKNSCKLPYDKEYVKLRNLIKEKDPNIFSFPSEFINHHSKKK
jgi:hypothetical protein